MVCAHSTDDICRACYDELIAKFNDLNIKHAQLMADYETAVAKRDELQAAIVGYNRVAVDQFNAVLRHVYDVADGELNGFHEWMSGLAQLVVTWRMPENAVTRARGHDLQEFMKTRRIIRSTEISDS